MSEFLINPHRTDHPVWMYQPYGAFGQAEVLEFHRSLPGYQVTPLHALPGMAAHHGLETVYVKDEGQRFGVKAFKPLGASYSIFRFLKEQYRQKSGEELGVKDFLKPEVMDKLGSFTFCAATDGNHGRAVAWTARQLRQKAVIYMPLNTVESRIENIRSEGAEVRLIDGTFDECVIECDRDAAKNHWQVIADTAYPGYMELPDFIMAGYSTIFHEMEGIIHHVSHTDVDLIIVQAGVGGLAAAACWYYRSHYAEKSPRIIIVEPVRADSFLESAKAGEPRDSRGDYQSIMAGLNCGVSLVAFPFIRDAADAFIAVEDIFAEQAMREYFMPAGSDPRIISGESGASGLAGLLALMHDDSLEPLRKYLGVGKNTRVLLINTEADTDPYNFQRIIAS